MTALKTYKAYIFDFDYTLADSSKGIVLCYRTVLERHGHHGIDDMTIKRTIGKTLEESFSLMTGITDVGILAQYKKEYVREADMHMTSNTFFFPETLGALRRLKERGAVLGIVSTKYRYRIHELFEKNGSLDLVDFIIGGEDVKVAKPAPEGLLLAVSRSGCTKDEVLYLGDSVVDALTAQAAGVDFVGVLHGMTTHEELAAYPHKAIIRDLLV